jgi:hypothetical protein
VRRFVPILEVATSLPFWSTARSEEAVSPVNQVLPELEKRVVEAFANCWSAEKEFADARLRLSEVEPPSATAPPPERPAPAETVSAEFASWLLPIVEVETKLVPLKERSCPLV